jgi:hypothetical protein
MSSKPAGGGLRMRDVRTGGMMASCERCFWREGWYDEVQDKRVVKSSAGSCLSRTVQLRPLEVPVTLSNSTAAWCAREGGLRWGIYCNAIGQ